MNLCHVERESDIVGHSDLVFLLSRSWDRYHRRLRVFIRAFSSTRPLGPRIEAARERLRCVLTRCALAFHFCSSKGN